MKKGIKITLLIIFLVFVSTRIVFASFPLGRFLGGRIINTKAAIIAEAESFGYQCNVPGTSITIRPIGSAALTPSEYFIPSYVTSKTGTTPAIGQYILGRYSGKTMISCYLADPPDAMVFSLDTINLFGTSKGIGF